MICAKEGKGALGLMRLMPPGLYGVLGKTPVSQLLLVEELRVAISKPIVLVKGDGCFYLTGEGKLTKDSSLAVRVSEAEVGELFGRLCEGSVYAAEEDIKKGYITAAGGHRVGICGTVTVKNGQVEAMRDISCLNIRIAREVTGSADGIIDEIVCGGLKNTLIISPPGGGKTTLLRDICRLLGGDGYDYKVALADERGEIAASCRGKPSNDVGARTCVMDGCPKAQAMEMLLRSMCPDVVITDEIGNGDEKPIENLMRCGVKVIASAHGRDFADVKGRMPFCRADFEKAIVLDKKRIREVITVGA